MFLSWDDNCRLLIKKVNARMQLLRGVLGFGASVQEMVHLWIVFCCSVIEQSCVVWHGSLTQENRDNLERTQKNVCKTGSERKVSKLWKCFIITEPRFTRNKAKCFIFKVRTCWNQTQQTKLYNTNKYQETQNGDKSKRKVWGTVCKYWPNEKCKHNYNATHAKRKREHRQHMIPIFCYSIGLFLLFLRIMICCLL